MVSDVVTGVHHKATNTSTAWLAGVVRAKARYTFQLDKNVAVMAGLDVTL